MLNINEEEIKKAIIEQAADQVVSQDSDLSHMVAREVESRVEKIFKERANAQIEAAIDAAIKESFNHEYQKVTQWGEPAGPKTTIRKELEKTVSGYWTAKVDAKTGKPSTSDYSSVTRAEFVMTQVCAEDFSKGVKEAVVSVTGALKDGLRKQIGSQMDTMLDSLFHVKSLQDQGKVTKPY